MKPDFTFRSFAGFRGGRAHAGAEMTRIPYSIAKASVALLEADYTAASSALKAMALGRG